MLLYLLSHLFSLFTTEPAAMQDESPHWYNTLFYLFATYEKVSKSDEIGIYSALLYGKPNCTGSSFAYPVVFRAYPVKKA